MAKKIFLVGVREVHVQMYKVLAETPKKAVREVANGGGEMLEGSLEYSHTLDPETWTVEEGE